MRYLVLFAVGLAAVAAQQAPQDAPPFLTGAAPDVIKQFYDLLKADETKSDPQIDADIEAFVTKLGGDYKTRFDKFKQELKEGQAQYEKAHQAAVSKFSPAAKEADAKMSAIADNPTLNGIQKRQQIKAIMDSLDEKTRNEIISALSGGQ
ncbi:unnamed protein product [Gongylonema pulchrum]|uniref:DUF148 domain-containing protein n=1 Tax=Gongylonema pulchrum TaxID=637853 RepID=A0A183D3S7_9BILA|nr:unnamed protein product [Gongylonema pulchrum]